MASIPCFQARLEAIATPLVWQRIHDAIAPHIPDLDPDARIFLVSGGPSGLPNATICFARIVDGGIVEETRIDKMVSRDVLRRLCENAAFLFEPGNLTLIGIDPDKIPDHRGADH